MEDEEAIILSIEAAFDERKRDMPDIDSLIGVAIQKYEIQKLKSLKHKERS